jgi:hypothetical protein
MDDNAELAAAAAELQEALDAAHVTSEVTCGDG